MLSKTLRCLLGLFASFMITAGASASSAPIANWSAPPYWSPASVKRTGVSARPLSIQSDVTGALPFVAVTPCRQYDSRNSSALANNTLRIVNMDTPPCSLPGSIAAVSVNITIFSITGATGNGVFKVGISNPPTTAWINYPPSEVQRANAGVLPVDSLFQALWVQVNQGGGSVQFTIDVNGYYASTLNNGEQLLITANTASGAIRGVNASGDGVQGQTNSAGSSGVFGTNTGGGKGVFGSSSGGNGVEGESSGGDGVHGHTSAGGSASGVAGLGDGGNNGVFGSSVTGVGVSGTSVSGDGVHGHSAGGSSSGVAGLNDVNGYGVYGSSAQGDGVHGETNGSTGASGVAGLDKSASTSENGVYGFSQHGTGLFGQSVEGNALVADGVAIVESTLGVEGDLNVVGNKNFVMPHPTDSSKEIVYTALEGPESGTYFRGTARIENGQATIDVPESFRLVTSQDGLTVQLTPLGDLAVLAVVSEDLGQIVVRGSQDVAFHYMVNGVRAGFENHPTIEPNKDFVPRYAADDFATRMPAEAVRRLKANGILNDDGSVNEETAHRLGWDQKPGWNAKPAALPN